MLLIEVARSGYILILLTSYKLKNIIMIMPSSVKNTIKMDGLAANTVPLVSVTAVALSDCEFSNVKPVMLTEDESIVSEKVSRSCEAFISREKERREGGTSSFT